MISHQSNQNLIIEKYVCKITMSAFHHYAQGVIRVIIFAHFSHLLDLSTAHILSFDMLSCVSTSC